MKFFILTFEQDAMEWFTEKLDNSFNTFESIVVAFKDKFGDKREDRHRKRMKRLKNLTGDLMVSLEKYHKLISLLMDLF